MEATGPSQRVVLVVDLAAAGVGLVWWRISHGIQVVTCDSGGPCRPAWHATDSWQWTLVHGLTLFGSACLVFAVHCMLTKRRRAGQVSAVGFAIAFIAWATLILA